MPPHHASPRSLSWALAALVGGVLVVAIGGAEIWLRQLKRFDGVFFQTAEVTEPWLHVMREGGSMKLRNSEFSQTLTGNSLGSTGPEPAEKQPGETRLVILGDSYTQGIGDLEGHGYPEIVEQSLARAGSRSVKVLNAGVGGSDPIFELEMLKRRVLRYKPDIVLFAYNETDVSDVLTRGGPERFDENGWIRPQPRPWWAPLLKASYILRSLILLRYDRTLIPLSEFNTKYWRALETLVETGKAALKLSREKGFKLAIVLLPGWGEAKSLHTGTNLTLIGEGLRNAGIETIDLIAEGRDDFPENLTEDYYWKLDGHFTHKGYQVLGRALAHALLKHGLLKVPGRR